MRNIKFGFTTNSSTDVVCIFFPELDIKKPTEEEGKLGSLFGIPSLPAHYMPRIEYLSPFRDILLKGETKTIGITGKPRYVGVQGMGGIGKSILAAALAYSVMLNCPVGGVYICSCFSHSLLSVLFSSPLPSI